MVLRPSRSCFPSISRLNKKARRKHDAHLVDLSDVLQRIDLVDLGLQLARLEQTEQLVGVVFKLLASLDVAKESRTSNLDTLGGEFAITYQSVR